MEAGTARGQQPRCRTRQPAWPKPAGTAYLPSKEGRGRPWRPRSCCPVGVPGPDRGTDTRMMGRRHHQARVLLQQTSSSSPPPPQTIFLFRFYYLLIIRTKNKVCT